VSNYVMWEEKFFLRKETIVHRHEGVIVGWIAPGETYPGVHSISAKHLWDGEGWYVVEAVRGGVTLRSPRELDDPDRSSGLWEQPHGPAARDGSALSAPRGGQASGHCGWWGVRELMGGANHRRKHCHENID